MHALGDVALPAAFGLAGLLVGWLYFRVLAHSVARLAERKGGVMWFVACALLRIALFGGGAAGALAFSGWCLIAYVLGFVLWRTVVVAKESRSQSEGEKQTR